jgi:NitT/TauT family transport system permease protein
MTVATMHAVHNVDEVHVRAAENFGVSRQHLLRTVIVPAILPQLLTGMRIALGIAWLVVVAAEMIAVDSGLGFLIIDARNAGNRYDLVVAGMVLIGAIGLLLDVMMRRIERLDSVRWGYAAE